MRSTGAEDDESGDAPIVTIVIPLFNGGRFIGTTLRSILAQTFRRFEVVVVDDGSTDDGPGVVRSHLADPRIRLVLNPHRGVSAARNDGAALAAAGCGFLVFMDADDVWQEDVLAVLLETLERRQDAAGAFVLAEYIDEAGALMDEGDFPRHMRSREDLHDGRLVPRDPVADVNLGHVFLTNPVYPPSCMMVRRDRFEEIGGFDPRVIIAEDWEFVIRLARRGPLVPVDRIKVGYRRHTSNASGNLALNVRGARAIWAATYYSAENSPTDRQQLRAIWRAHQARTAARKLSEGRALVASGRVVSGAVLAADGLAHRLLRSPPRFWAWSNRHS